MKNFIPLFLLLIPLTVGAQTVNNDSVRVFPDNELIALQYRSIDANVFLRPFNASFQEPLKESVKESFQEPLKVEGISSEEGRRGFDRSRLRIGLDFALSISDNYTYLGIGPQVGYVFSDFLMAGGGVKYYHQKVRNSQFELRSNLVGADVFGFIYPFSILTAFLRPEFNYIWASRTHTPTGDRVTFNGISPAIVVGAGIRMGGTHITVNYDLLQHENSPHPEGFFLGVAAFF